MAMSTVEVECGPRDRHDHVDAQVAVFLGEQRQEFRLQGLDSEALCVQGLGKENDRSGGFFCKVCTQRAIEPQVAWKIRIRSVEDEDMRFPSAAAGKQGQPQDHGRDPRGRDMLRSCARLLS
jgi:hypothetical protein